MKRNLGGGPFQIIPTLTKQELSSMIEKANGISTLNIVCKILIDYVLDTNIEFAIKNVRYQQDEEIFEMARSALLAGRAMGIENAVFTPYSERKKIVMNVDGEDIDFQSWSAYLNWFGRRKAIDAMYDEWKARRTKLSLREDTMFSPVMQAMINFRISYPNQFTNEMSKKKEVWKRFLLGLKENNEDGKPKAK